MKKITVLFPDEVEIDLSSLVTHAISLTMETVEVDGTLGKTKKSLKRGSAEQAKKVQRYSNPAMTSTETIMRNYRKGRTITRKNILEWLEDAGYQKGTAGGAIDRLKKAGHLKALEKGSYQFLSSLPDVDE